MSEHFVVKSHRQWWKQKAQILFTGAAAAGNTAQVSPSTFHYSQCTSSLAGNMRGE